MLVVLLIIKSLKPALTNKNIYCVRSSLVLRIQGSILDMLTRVHSSVWIEWLPAEQLVEGSNPSGPASILVLFSGFHKNKVKQEKLETVE
jgi:hypothetical protein